MWALLQPNTGKSCNLALVRASRGIKSQTSPRKFSQAMHMVTLYIRSNKLVRTRPVSVLLMLSSQLYIALQAEGKGLSFCLRQHYWVMMRKDLLGNPPPIPQGSSLFFRAVRQLRRFSSAEVTTKLLVGNNARDRSIIRYAKVSSGKFTEKRKSKPANLSTFLKRSPTR
jgi:hypothetical protein